MIVYPNAKINIGLNVVERRSDNYHNIETIFYPIGLSDVLSVEKSETCTDYSISFDGIPIQGDAENNLILKAYRLLQQKFTIPPVDIFLSKQIPFGAGLGGGSSDGAFMLKVLNEKFDLDLSVAELEKLASQLGADCPFFIQNKPVFATGIGNQFSPVEFSLMGYWLLLVKPDVFVSTAEAYSGLIPEKTEFSLPELIKNPIENWRNTIKNDFEKTIFKKHPFVGEIKEKIYQLGAVYAAMSGSGSSVYGIFSEKPLYDSLFDNCFVVSGLLE